MRDCIAAIKLRPEIFNMALATCPDATCGSAGCIFGWAVVLNFQEYFPEKNMTPALVAPMNVYLMGARIFGLPCRENMSTVAPPAEGEEVTPADRLFFGTLWPKPWRWSNTAEQARFYRDPAILEARVEHFIKTNGAE